MRHVLKKAGAKSTASTVASFASSPKLYPIQRGLTQLLWGLDWKRHFPLSLDGNLTVDSSTFAEADAFAKENFRLIYGDAPQNQFLIVDDTPARNNFYEQAGDFFLFKDGPANIGMFVGNALDWSTYYIRSISILPDYQGLKLYQQFLAHLIQCLTQRGVARVEVHIAPSNLAHVHVANKLGFAVSGTLLSERWGALTHFTKYLGESNQLIFEKQFCAGKFSKR